MRYLANRMGARLSDPKAGYQTRQHLRLEAIIMRTKAVATVVHTFTRVLHPGPIVCTNDAVGGRIRIVTPAFVFSIMCTECARGDECPRGGCLDCSYLDSVVSHSAAVSSRLDTHPFTCSTVTGWSAEAGTDVSPCSSFCTITLTEYPAASIPMTWIE